METNLNHIKNKGAIMETMNNYEQQAQDFLNKTGTTFKAEYLKHDKYFIGDEYSRDIYNITLKRGNREYSFTFGQSLKDSVMGRNEFTNIGTKRKFSPICPTAYDVLSCLQKYDVGTFEDFCAEFGYDTDSRKAEKVYNAVCSEWLNIQRLFTDEEIEELREIQ